MNSVHLFRFLETVMIGVTGGFVFAILALPLPWVLGALTFVLVWQGFTKRKALFPDPLKNTGFLTLGIYFGLYFTAATFITVGPYILPYVAATVILIMVSIAAAIFVSKRIKVDEITSVFGSIPGGLTEMAIASEALKANSSLVIIFQTVRLLTVLFIVPVVIIFAFSQGQTGTGIPVSATNAPVQSWGLSALWFIIPAAFGIWKRNLIPAGIVIIPLFFTAVINIFIVSLPVLPPLLLISAQVAVGIGLGKRISFEDLKAGGKYCFVYGGIAVLLIIVSFGLGGLLSFFTTLNLPTALLSVAPGGLIEMVLTASIVGGDPAVVSALQLTRLLVIIIFVPPLLKWYFNKKAGNSQSSTTSV
ncbi:AbrB family transcriptional regulator [Bacillus sp. H-16]|uniref:AbrB family transcriptional regulator n=1 Tax=Alteribacter salitolerans TaxID=2912333 RepID=UPI0019657169|nr:AbrB family transcriptional regulator [Alteribacter salitolerans]MBM7094448.1 AbrB family transcriptional regulator [Alteribacter salitolerans]